MFCDKHVPGIPLQKFWMSAVVELYVMNLVSECLFQFNLHLNKMTSHKQFDIKLFSLDLSQCLRSVAYHENV